MDASSLLGIPYELVLRYVRELEGEGSIEIERKAGRLYFSAAHLELIKRHHEKRPQGSKFRVEGNADLHQHVLQDLKTLASTLEAMAKLARVRCKELIKAPACSTTWISTLPVAGLTLRKPIQVSVVSDGKAFSAFCGDTGSTATGRNRPDAVRALRQRLAAEYVYLDQLATLSAEEAERLATLRQLIRDPEREPIP